MPDAQRTAKEEYDGKEQGQRPGGADQLEEADELLKELGAKQREVTRIELDLTERIAALKQNAKLAVKMHQADITLGEKQLAMFAKLHEDDFGKAKSKALTHGVIGWRKSTAVKLTKTVAETVAILLKLGKRECVRQAAPTVDKAKARQMLCDAELKEAGMTVDKDDVFFWEPDEASIPNMAGDKEAAE